MVANRIVRKLCKSH